MSRLSSYLLIILIYLQLTGCSLFDSILTRLSEVCEQPIYTVNSTSPGTDHICTTDDCTLRDAIATASICEGVKTVILSDSDYYLDEVDNNTEGENALPIIKGRINIEGNGARITARRFDDRNIGRLFYIEPDANLSIENVTVSGGIASDCLTCASISERDTRYHGGCFVNNGRLTLENVQVHNCNSDGKGGAIYNTGTLNIRSSEFRENLMPSEGGGSGAAIYNESGGIAQISLSNFNRNRAESNGGAIYNRGNMQIYTSRFLENHVEIHGGAIMNAGNIEINTSTIVLNYAGSWGGGISNNLDARILLSTIAENSIRGNQGAGIFNNSRMEISETTIYANRVTRVVNPLMGVGIYTNDSASTLITLSTVANNEDGRDCAGSGTFTTRSTANLDSDNSCEGFTLNGDPQLTRYRDNGGPTPTYAPTASSPIIDAGGFDCSIHDQRGAPYTRRVDGNSDGIQECDLGAIEFRE